MDTIRRWASVSWCVALIMTGCQTEKNEVGDRGELAAPAPTNVSGGLLEEPTKRNRYPTSVTGLDGLRIDETVARRVKAARESHVTQEDAGTPVVLYSVNDGVFAKEVYRRLADAIDRAVNSSGRYGEMAVPVHSGISLLEASGIVLVQEVYPATEVSNTLDKEKLSITVWICPDRPTAMTLFDLRSGNKNPQIGEGAARGDGLRDARFTTLPTGKDIGEASYVFSPGIVYNAPLPRTDQRRGGDRVGFLRRNVVVETSTWDYFRGAPEEQWLTLGLLSKSAPEVMKVLRELDSFICAEGGED